MQNIWGEIAEHFIEQEQTFRILFTIFTAGGQKNLLFIEEKMFQRSLRLTFLIFCLAWIFISINFILILLKFLSSLHGLLFLLKIFYTMRNPCVGVIKLLHKKDFQTFTIFCFLKRTQPSWEIRWFKFSEVNSVYF